MASRMERLRTTDRAQYELIMSRSRLATETITAMGGAGQLRPDQPLPSAAVFARFRDQAADIMSGRNNPATTAAEMGRALVEQGYLSIDPELLKNMEEQQERQETVTEDMSAVITTMRPSGRYAYTGEEGKAYTIKAFGQEYTYVPSKNARMTKEELYGDIARNTILSAKNQQRTFDVLSALADTSAGGYGAAYANEIAVAFQGASYQQQRQALNKLTADMASRVNIDRIDQRVAENFARGNADVLSGMYQKLNEASQFISEKNNLAKLDSAGPESTEARTARFIATMSKWMSPEQAAELSKRPDIVGILREPDGVSKAVEFSVRGAMVSGLSEQVALGEMGARVYGIQDITAYTERVKGGLLGSGEGLSKIQALASVAARGGGWGDYQTAFAGLEKFAIAGGASRVAAVAEELRARGDAAAADLVEQGTGRVVGALGRRGGMRRSDLIGMLRDVGAIEGQGRGLTNEQLIQKTMDAFEISSGEARKIVTQHGKGVEQATIEAMSGHLREAAARRAIVGQEQKQREAADRKREMAEAFRDGMGMVMPGGALQVTIKGGVMGMLVGTPPGTEGTDETGGGSATGTSPSPPPPPR